MTREEYHHWLTHVFKDKDKCRLLVVDSYKPHVSDESREIVTSKCNSSLVITPGDCTSIVQPMGRQAVQRWHEGELDGMDEVRPSHNKNGQPKTADTTQCHQLGVEGMDIHQSGDHHEIFPELWHKQCS